MNHNRKQLDTLESELLLIKHRNSLRLRIARDPDNRELRDELAREEALDRAKFPHLAMYGHRGIVESWQNQ